MNQEIIKLSPIEHLIKRPGMYIGNTTLVKSEEFIFEDNKIFRKEIEFVPAFIKIFREILDNSIDEYIKTDGKFGNKIKIDIDEKTIQIEDNGRGLSSVIDDEYKIPKAVMALTESMAGSNFNDDSNSIGQNGVGAFGSNVFSKIFTLDTSDGIKRTRMICKNNINSTKHKQNESTEHYTKIKFMPDFEKLSLTNIDEIHFNIIYKNILDLAVSFPKIKFYFNNKIIKNKKFSEYIKLYSEEFEIFDSKNCDIAVIHNQEIDQVSFVNGINTKNGGNHVEYISQNICQNLRNILIKKFKTIKPIDIKNNCFFIINIKNMIAPRFDSQLKENLTTPLKDINNLLQDLNFDDIAKKLSKSDFIIEPILESFKLKEELKRRAELKNQEKKVGKKIVPKLLEANGKNPENKILFLVEGDSAAGSAILVRDSDIHAIYPISGKFVNCFELTPSELIKKKSISELLSVIGLKLSSPEVNNLNYGKIAIFTDEDTDGNCIAALLINFFFKYWPDLFEYKKMYKVKSYLILAKHKETGKEKKFLSVEDFENENDYELLEYNKGLGSLDEDDYREAMNTLECLIKDDLSKETLKMAFSKEGDRKKWMLKK